MSNLGRKDEFSDLDGVLDLKICQNLESMRETWELSGEARKTKETLRG